MRNLLILLLWFLSIGTGRYSYAQETSQPIQIGDGTLRRVRVPILMYHYVSPLPIDADSIREGLTVSPNQFYDHMNYLSSVNYHTISLYEMNSAINNGTPLPQNPIVLTFDDGYIDHYSYVFPVLKEFGFIGTFFIITDFVDANNPNYLTWTQIQEMSQAGMNIESHTKSHQRLENRSYDYLIWEIVGSQETLQSHTGDYPTIFAYPGGFYDSNTLTILDTTQINRAVTTEHGTYHTSHDYLLSPRLRIAGGMTGNGLKNLLENAP